MRSCSLRPVILPHLSLLQLLHNHLSTVVSLHSLTFASELCASYFHGLKLRKAEISFVETDISVIIFSIDYKN